jgi:putative lipoprotein
MKTTAKLSLLAAAFLLMIAGCANNFTPTEPSKDSFAKNVENKNTDIIPLQVVGTISSTLQTYGDDSGYRVTINFTAPVDLERVKTAVSFNKLNTVTNATDPAQVGAAIDFTVLTEGMDPKNTKAVHFKLKTADNVKVYAYVTGKELKAANTNQMMDQDRDGEQGEVVDDDYGEIFDIGSPDGKYGRTGYLSVGAANATLNGIFGQISFIPENNWFPEKKNENLGSLVTRIAASNYKESNDKLWTTNNWGISNDEYGRLLNAHIRVEQFKDNKWESITPVFKKYPLSNGSEAWVADISVEADTEIRWKIVDIHNIIVKNADTSLYGYDLKYTNRNTAKSTVLQSRMNSGKTKGTIAFNKANAFATTYSSQGKFILTLNPSAFSYYDGTTDHTLTPVMKDNRYTTDYAGLVPATLTKDKFQFDGEAKYTAKNTYKDDSYSAWIFSGEKSLYIEVPFTLVKEGELSKQIQVESLSFAPSNLGLHPNATADQVKLKLDAKAFDESLKALYKETQTDNNSVKYNSYKNNELTKAFCEAVDTTIRTKVAEKNASHVYRPFESHPLISELETIGAVQNYVANAISRYVSNFPSSGNVAVADANETLPALYVAPTVETAAFTAMYPGASGAVEVKVNKFNFTSVTPNFTNQLEKDNWTKLTLW